MKKLKIYGDSILKGVMYSEELKRYRLYGYRFDELAARGVEVENNCKMGATVDKGFEIMRDTLSDCGKDTVVVMEFGGNDCDYNWKAVSENPDIPHFCNTPEDKFIETYRKAIKYALDRGADVRVCTLVPIESGKFMDWITRGLSYDTILGWLGDVNMLARWQEYYSRLSERVAAEAGVPVLDLRTAFLRAQLADRLQHRKLAVKVVIKAALGEVHLIQDVLHGRLLVALRIKQTFRRGQQLATARIALLHSII